MLALSGKDPWWSLIIFGEKCLETRSWAPGMRAAGNQAQPPFRVALHLSAQMDAADRQQCYDDPVFRAAVERHGVTFRRRKRDYEGSPSYDPIGLRPAGHIVGVATVALVERMTKAGIPEGCFTRLAYQRTGPGWDPDQERAFGYYAAGRYAWLLTDVRPLARPLPARGALGLWKLPADLEAAVLGQLEER